MKNRNTMGPMWFLFEHIFLTFLLAAWLFKGIFRCLPGYTFADSKRIFWIFAGVCMAVGILLTIKRRRNSLSVVVNTTTAFVVYGWLTYFNTLPTVFRTVFYVAAVLCAAYGALVLFLHFKRPLASFAACLTHAFLGARTIAVLCLSVIWIPVFLSLIFGSALFQPDVQAKSPLEETVAVAEDMDAIANLQEETWATLSTQQRLDTMQLIANMEAAYLGIPHELNVGGEAMAERNLGYYADATHEIRISVDSLEYDSVETVLDTLCHEAYHAYQYRLCDAYDSVGQEYQDLIVFSSARAYKDNFANYPDPDVDFDKYYNAACEANARTYAKGAVKRYMAKLENNAP